MKTTSKNDDNIVVNSMVLSLSDIFLTSISSDKGGFGAKNFYITISKLNYYTMDSVASEKSSCVSLSVSDCLALSAFAA